MKPNKPNFWIVIAALYLVVLCTIIVIYNPDFLQWKNCLLLLPLYAPLGYATHLIHKSDEDSNKEIWSTRSALICATIIVVIVKKIVS